MIIDVYIYRKCGSADQDNGENDCQRGTEFRMGPAAGLACLQTHAFCGFSTAVYLLICGVSSNSAPGYVTTSSHSLVN